MYEKRGIKVGRLLSVVTVVLLVLSMMGSFSYILNPSAAQDTNDEAVNIVYESLDYHVNVTDSYAVTNVKAVLNNPTDETLEGNVPFYFPEEAFLTNLTLVLNEDVYYADVVESQEAEKEYEEAVESNQSAALGDYESGGLFNQKVNIKPGTKAEVTIRYEMLLERKIGGYDYEMNLDSFSQYSDGLFDEFSYEMMIRYSKPIETVDTGGMIDGTQKEYVDPYTANVEYSGDLIPGEYVLNYDVNVAGLEGDMNFYEDERGTYFMHRMRPDIEDVGKIPKDIVFVLDKSGSMSGTKIQQMKTSFKHIIDKLETNERFNVITFNTEVTPYSQEMLEVNSDNKGEVKDHIDSIDAGGSTNINGATLKGIETINKLELGYGERAAIIVLLTDGLPTAGVTNTASIRQNVLEANTRGISIFSLGFGNDVDFGFLKAMSLENNGYAKKIYEGQDASEQIIGFYETISTPLLRDIEVGYEDVTDSYPKEVKTLFSGSDLVIVGRVKNDTEDIRSEFKAESKDGTIYLNDTWNVGPDEDNNYISRLWAYRYINHLLDRMAVEGENETIRSEIVSIATNYSFVTPYTSFLITVESTDNEEEEESVDDLQGPSADAKSNLTDIDDDDSGLAEQYGEDSPGFTTAVVLNVILVVTLIWAKKRKKFKRDR